MLSAPKNLCGQLGLFSVSPKEPELMAEMLLAARDLTGSERNLLVLRSNGVGFGSEGK